MKKFIDKKNHFVEVFNPNTGFYARSGILDENGIDTNIDPFMRCFPSLIDIGIMEKCVCASQCNVDCYQKAIERKGNNMSLSDYKIILEQCKGKVLQVALGGAGDVDTHENFEEILRLTREYDIVPNFTTSGIAMTDEKAQICKKYCGAIAVSEHNADYTNKALDMLIKAGVKTNIHYVLSKKTIDGAIYKLKTNTFFSGINAVVFLLYKPIGLGTNENVLQVNDTRVKEFFDLINKNSFHHKIGFDSCSCPGIVNYTDKIDYRSLDFCEGARHSMYIDSKLNAMPCSFANQNPLYFIDLHKNTIQEAWESDIFEKFRNSLKNSCSSCKDKNICSGGCPICRNIVLCDRKEKDLL